MMNLELFKDLVEKSKTEDILNAIIYTLEQEEVKFEQLEILKVEYHKRTEIQLDNLTI